MSLNLNDYRNILSFIKELEQLKTITRTAWTKNGRQESVAEHSWRLALFAFALEDHFPDLNYFKVILLCLVHDLGEAYEGDVSAKLESDQELKINREEEAMIRLLSPLPEPLKEKFLSLWQEYIRGETKEAKLVKALDKMETIIQHNQGLNPKNFDYAFNLTYGKALADVHPILKSIREIIDEETKQNMAK